MKATAVKLLAIIVLVCSGLSAQGQDLPPSAAIDTVFFHVSPKNKHRVVNGCSVGFSIHPWEDNYFVKLNGLNIEVGPFGIIMGIYGTMFGLAGVKDPESGHKTSFFSRYGYTDSAFGVKCGTYVNGVSISLGGLTETFNSGLIINGLSSLSFTTKGIVVSGLINESYELTGVSVAVLANVSTKVKGVQIGLINKCRSGQLVQIGLWNRIGKRVTPFINFRFRKD